MMIKFAINGFGRIGRSILRALAERNDADLECAVINCGTGDLKSHLHLFKHDSTHGNLGSVIQIDESTFTVNGKTIKAVFETDINKLDWSKYRAEVVFECTGIFTKRDSAILHVHKAGARKVIVSAPAENVDATIVYKVNNSALKSGDEVISIGSCTTNCLAPIAKVLHDSIGINQGFMTTIHAYTNDQMLLDGNHKDLRRARSAAASMIPTSTGAAKAIGLVIPELIGKLDGVAIRVPVPNVSMIELVFNSARATTIEEINSLIKAASAGSMDGVLGYTEEELVSIDFNHNPLSSIFDATQTKIIGPNLCKVSAWYDNEWGFSNRMLDVAKLWSNAKP
ncbi:MAG: type I glyceraldehyde-3-phosphate dehydrogenase [Candidatus Jidaibacter sp.]|nr:type I glyceraldehyde-3-phosphate dehydrogenase [Candidatus Jidaibacter sp.]